MTLTLPDDMEKLVYFTRRKIGEGKVIAWVDKQICEKCGKGLMAKPKDPKTGKPKIRATEYVCESCGNAEEKKEHEESLVLEVKYTCPDCGNVGEATTEYRRKSFQGVPSYVFTCGKCGVKIGITKKMKESKKGVL